MATVDAEDRQERVKIELMLQLPYVQINSLATEVKSESEIFQKYILSLIRAIRAPGERPDITTALGGGV
ncbi:MAG: hypothetical protein AMJ65_08185 [Phycisphaerae bacterium SG8_4]|nr:MAG: hypothetical protein AMJ65_08185 [Phycisphaerae bacterium SG8_4]